MISSSGGCERSLNAAAKGVGSDKSCSVRWGVRRSFLQLFYFFMLRNGCACACDLH